MGRIAATEQGSMPNRDLWQQLLQQWQQEDGSVSRETKPVQAEEDNLGGFANGLNKGLNP